MDIMTLAQQELVSQNLNVVDIIIRKYITVRPDIPGMEYDDLYQIGSLALCKAATRFDGRCKFSTFASKVVLNDLKEYCRNSCKTTVSGKSLDAPVTEDCSLALAELLSAPDTTPDSTLCKALASAKQNYSGCSRMGIEAMELKLKGYSGAEIAELYGVKNNLVTAWISRATSRLRNDEKFLAEFS